MFGIKPWIGVDLDGTLARYDGWVDAEHIGKIIVPMKNLILDLIKEDIEVRIFTARVAGNREGCSVKQTIKNIQDWLEANGLPRLEVTNIKDFYMLELYDDRAVQVEFNTGVCYGESTLKYRRLLKK